MPGFPRRGEHPGVSKRPRSLGTVVGPEDPECCLPPFPRSRL
ncbi:hypothetical protein HMPREF1979_00421 [Actinomyces johnsonii F0542]|uniref:Uncharacterized protein n=1 Tax=Actinomyces johnsonii F0542 TaxID=1321818 RepID=U1S0T5_9ACTO|nr:hypothetical protein HMPREF1979_00421 [Actinomyces johnsonii F0542]